MCEARLPPARVGRLGVGVTEEAASQVALQALLDRLRERGEMPASGTSAAIDLRAQLECVQGFEIQSEGDSEVRQWLQDHEALRYVFPQYRGADGASPRHHSDDIERVHYDCWIPGGVVHSGATPSPAFRRAQAEASGDDEFVYCRARLEFRDGATLEHREAAMIRRDVMPR